MLLVGFVGVAVANRVSNRIILAPLLKHTYFLAVLTSLVQLTAFGSLLCRRVRCGMITAAMWSFAARKPFLLAAFGLCEGAFMPIVFYAAARLPGGLVQVLNQMLVPFTVIFSASLLGRRYTAVQLTGVLGVLAGVLLMVTGSPLVPAGSTKLFGVYVLLCIAAYGLMALAMVIKEIVLTSFQKEDRADVPEGQVSLPFDPCLFLTAATAARTATVLAGWPVYLRMVAPSASVGQQFVEGLQALARPEVLTWAVVYWVCNGALSIIAILLVQRTSASAVVLANVIALPLSAFLFCCPLPFLEAQPFQLRLAASLAIVILGNLVYNGMIFKGKSGK